MKFSAREDIEAPIAHVFARVSDFDWYSRRAMRQGAEVVRVDSGAIVEGSAWDVTFYFRGRERRMNAVLNKLEPPYILNIDLASDGLSVASVVELVALSPGRTRLMVSFDLRAKTLTARLLLQSMKLAKTKLTNRFKARVVEFAEDIEDDYRKAAQTG